MKKVSLLILLCFYTWMVCGVNLQIHYCGGKYKSVSFFGKGDEKGCCGSKKKSKRCCQNKQAVIKLKDSHQSAQALEIRAGQLHDAVMVTPGFSLNTVRIAQVSLITPYHSPPILYNTPLYVRHRVLII